MRKIQVVKNGDGRKKIALTLTESNDILSSVETVTTLAWFVDEDKAKAFTDFFNVNIVELGE